ncbi:unnamed protein product, partial [Closterium sp. NIES-53]
MYALTDSAEGDCYLSVAPDPGIEAAALGASASAALGTGESAAPGAGESALSGTTPTEALHTFTLDSGASRSFFRDSTTLTLLSRPVAFSLADPSGGPVLAHSSTVLPCRAAPSGLLSRLHLPSFSMNLVSGVDLQDAWVAASSQVFAAASRSSPASAPSSCRPVSHENLLWHHRLGHPSLSRLRGMASRTLVSGQPRSLPPLPLGPAPTCVPCVKGRQRAAPHSSTFPPTEAPLQTLHMDVWGPARVRGQGHERYFLLVVDDYSHYTTVFPMRNKGEVLEVLIDWICGARRQLSERFGSDLPVLRLHSDRGGEFSSDLLRAFYHAEGIHQTFTLPASPQQNGIAERRIGMVMDVARTSMIHVAAPHFLWPFVVQYAAHQINLQPCVSLPETTPTLRWMGKVGDASAWQFYHPTLCRVLSSQDVTFDESVSYYHPAEPVEVAVDSGAARGAEPAGARTGGAEPGGVDSGGAASWGAEPACAESGGSPTVPLRREPLSPQRLPPGPGDVRTGGTRAAGAGAAGGAAGSGAAGGPAGAGAAGGAAGARATGGAASAGATGGAAGAGAAGGAAGAGAVGGVARTGAAGDAAGAGATEGWRCIHVPCLGISSFCPRYLRGQAFYHPTSRRVLSSQDVTFDESVSYYRLFPYRTASLPPPPPLFLAPDPAEPVEVAVDSGSRVESGGAELERVEPGGTEPWGTASWGAEPARAESGGSPGVPLRRESLSLQRLCEWYARCCRRATVAAGARATNVAAGAGAGGDAAGAGAAGGAAGARAAGGAADAGAAGGAGPGGARTGGTGAAGAGGAAGVGAAGTGAGGIAGVVTRDPGAEGTSAVSTVSGGAARPRPYYLQPPSPLPGPSPYSGLSRGLTERREPESRPLSPEPRPASPESRFESRVRTVCAGRRVSRSRPPPIPGTHSMTLHPSTAPQRIPLPSPPASSLPDGPDPESDSLRAASPTVTRFLATAVTDPFFESTAASALVAELLDFAAPSRLDYATSLVAESTSASVCPPSVRGECALGTDVLEDRQEEFECFAADVRHLVSMLLAPEGDPDAPDIPTPLSYAEAKEGTYVDEVPPPGANIVSGMSIFSVKRPSGSPPVFKARYVARGFSQRHGVDFFQTFSPTPKMTTLQVLLHVAAQRDYELHSLDFSTAFLQGSLHEEIWLCRPPGFIGSFPASTQWNLRRPVYGLRQARPLAFAPSTADPSLFLRTDTTLLPFYVLV